MILSNKLLKTEDSGETVPNEVFVAFVAVVHQVLY